MKQFFSIMLLVVFALVNTAFCQTRSILIPKPVPGTPFKYDDQQDLFGQSYRWFLEGDYPRAVDSIKTLITKAGFALNPKNYYVVVANFADNFSPIGLIHGDNDFLSTRIYGLGEKNLYYILISRRPQASSFLSVLVTAKDSPFIENLPAFISLFIPLVGQVPRALAADQETWIDVRQFEVPKEFRKYSELSVIVKKDLADEEFLATADFDNTSLERWSYGIATAITTVDDVDITIGSYGTIIIEPKPNKDLATFAVINYHFKPVDTKAKTLATSFHLLGGLRLANSLEPIIGIGGGVALGFIDLHLFAGYSVEFANVLKDEYQDEFKSGQKITAEDNPFKLKVRGKPRFGIEIKFP